MNSIKTLNLTLNLPFANLILFANLLFFSMSKTIGKVGSKQYTLQKIIGQGSFGKVYLSKNYAVKQVSLNLPPYLKTSLQNEIKILKTFKHPNIVSLVDVVYEQKQVYLVMEYCQMDLSKYIKKYKTDQKNAIYILKNIISGFSQLVDKGIIHRDLKPANILVNSKGQFKLADFGFAKYVDHFDSKLLHSIVGTPLYMAPQILKKSKYTTKCDIWSIGYIFYQLLTSKVPWTGISQADLYNNITKKPLVIPDYVSQWSSTILKKMLVVIQNDRISWEELIKYVLSSERGNVNNIDKISNHQRQKSTQKRIQSNQRQNLKPKQEKQKQLKEPKDNTKQFISAKPCDLLALFQIQLIDYFNQDKINNMMRDKNYRFSTQQLVKINKILQNFTGQYQAFIKDYFKMQK